MESLRRPETPTRAADGPSAPGTRHCRIDVRGAASLGERGRRRSRPISASRRDGTVAGAPDRREPAGDMPPDLIPKSGADQPFWATKSFMNDASVSTPSTGIAL